MSGNIIAQALRQKSQALIIALAIYTPGVVRCSQDHEDYVYAAVKTTGFYEEQKAELYAYIAEALVPEMRLDGAQAAIELAIAKVQHGDIDQPEPNALEIAEYQYATTAYDFRIHPEADRQIRLLMKELYAATLREAGST